MLDNDHLGAVAEVPDDDDGDVVCDDCQGLNGTHFRNCAYWDPNEEGD